jgi:D-alanine-D-alanine ligase
MSGSKQRIAVLVDGFSRHREIALREGEAVVAALAEAGHDAAPVFVDRDLDLALRQGRFDVAFVLSRGRYASDGCLQGALELLGIPYTGSSLLACSLATNRGKAKEILRLCNLPTAPAYIMRSDSDRRIVDHHGSFGFPVVVSPIGVGLPGSPTLVNDELDLETAVEHAFRLGDEVLVERLVDGRAVTVAVLDGTAMGAMDMGPLVSRLDTGAPVSDRGELGGRLRIRFAVARQRSLLRIAEQTCEALGIEGPALVELTVSDRLNEVVRAVDPVPGLLPGGIFARIAASAGLAYEDLIEEVLRGARLRAHGRRRERRAAQVPFAGGERRMGAHALMH